MNPADIYNLTRYDCTDGNVRTVLWITDNGMVDYRVDGGQGSDELELAPRVTLEDFAAAAIEEA